MKKAAYVQGVQNYLNCAKCIFIKILEWKKPKYKQVVIFRLWGLSHFSSLYFSLFFQIFYNEHYYHYNKKQKDTSKYSKVVAYSYMCYIKIDLGRKKEL